MEDLNKLYNMYFEFNIIKIQTNNLNKVEVLFKKNNNILIFNNIEIEKYIELCNKLKDHLEYINNIDLKDEEIAYIEYNNSKKIITIRYKWIGQIYKFIHKVNINDYVVFEFFDFLHENCKNIE